MREFKGAFQLARQTFNSDIFFWKPDKWFKIWIFIIGICNHVDSKQFSRGETLTTYYEIQYYTKSSVNEVKHCISYLRKSSMITTHRTTRGLRIKVAKYNDFQTFDRYKGENFTLKALPKAIPEANSKPIKSPTIVNNVNNEKNDIYNRFKEPTIEEVDIYCKERKNTVNPQKFIDFYKSKGWMVGKNKMKDWKACVRTWEGNNFNKTDNLKVASGKYNNIKKTTINDNPPKI